MTSTFTPPRPCSSFPKLFFPGQNETTQLLASFAVFGVAFIARPLGSVVFGHFGDKFGRKGTLVASLLTMGIATFLIGCLPTATVPGWTFLAPALLVVLRFCQGLALGGEWSGAALLATENAPANKRAIYGTFPQLGAPIGFIIANVIFLVFSYTLTPEAFMEWGWRVPFLLSAVMVIIGLYVRLKLIETPAFTKVVESNEVAKLPLARVFKTSWRPLILGTFIMLATYVLFYLMTTFTLTYGTRASSLDAAKAAAEKAGKPMTEAAAAAFVPGLGYSRNDFLWMLIAGVVFFGIFTLVSGPLAEKFGRRKMLIVVTFGILAFGLLFVPLFSAGFVGAMALLIIGFSLMGLTFGPMGALLPELFPTQRPLHRLRHQLQRLQHPGRCRGSVHRRLALGTGRGQHRAGGRLPRRHGGADADRPVREQGNPGPRLHQQRSLTSGPLS